MDKKQHDGAQAIYMAMPREKRMAFIWDSIKNTPKPKAKIRDFVLIEERPGSTMIMHVPCGRYKSFALRIHDAKRMMTDPNLDADLILVIMDTTEQSK